MTPSFRLAALVALSGLAACVARPPNNTTAEGQAFYACDRPAVDQTADVDSVVTQIRERERIRGECLASGNIPPLPGAKYVEAPVVLAPLPPGPETLPPAMTPPPSNVPASQDYQPAPLIQPPG